MVRAILAIFAWAIVIAIFSWVAVDVGPRVRNCMHGEEPNNFTLCTYSVVAPELDDAYTKTIKFFHAH